MEKPTKVTWQNVKMEIHNTVKTIREVNVIVYPDGTKTMLLDEFNRILWELYNIDKEKNKRNGR